MSIYWAARNNTARQITLSVAQWLLRTDLPGVYIETRSK